MDILSTLEGSKMEFSWDTEFMIYYKLSARNVLQMLKNKPYSPKEVKLLLFMLALFLDSKKSL